LVCSGQSKRGLGRRAEGGIAPPVALASFLVRREVRAGMEKEDSGFEPLLVKAAPPGPPQHLAKRLKARAKRKRVTGPPGYSLTLDDSGQPYWGLNLVLSWIAFRPKVALSREELRSELFRRLTYEKGEGVVDGNPRRSLMLALRSKLTAYDENGVALSPEFWAHRGFDDRNWPPVVFRREDVLAVFPDPNAPPASSAPETASLAAPAKAPRRPRTTAAVDALRALYPHARPPKLIDDMRSEVEKRPGCRNISRRTFERALIEAW